MRFILKIWCQFNVNIKGYFVIYEMDNVFEYMFFLEMFDVLNEDLIQKQEELVVFEYDCCEGICGICSMVINGYLYGFNYCIMICQLYMCYFKDGEIIVIELFCVLVFLVIKDLVVDCFLFDKIIQVGGFILVNIGQVQDVNVILVEKSLFFSVMDVVECIGCGVCVVVCFNVLVMLFVSVKVSYLVQLL